MIFKKLVDGVKIRPSVSFFFCFSQGQFIYSTVHSALSKTLKAWRQSRKETYSKRTLKKLRERKQKEGKIEYHSSDKS